MNAAKPPRQAWVAIGCAWLLGYSMYAGLLCVPPIGHVIRDEFHLSYAQLGFLVALPLAVLAATAIPAGMLSDRIGIKKATVIGAAMLAAGSFFRGTVSDYRLLYVFTALFGLGFAVIFPNLSRIAHAWFGRERAGLATGIYSTGVALGGTIPYIMPILLPAADKSQGVFFLWSAPAIAAFILCSIALKEPAYAGPRPAVNRIPTRDLLSDRNLWFASLLMLANSMHFYVWITWAPSLMVLKGATPEIGSAITSMRGWAGMPATFLLPLVSYRMGRRKPFLWGSGLLLGLASLWAIYVSVSWGWWMMAVVGIVVSGSFSMILALPAELSRGASVGSASGMMLSIGYIGGLIAPWLAGYLFDITGSLNSSFIALIAIGLGWAVVGALIPETGRKRLPAN